MTDKDPHHTNDNDENSENSPPTDGKLAGERQKTFSRRALLEAGWSVPLIAAVQFPTDAFAVSIPTHEDSSPGHQDTPGTQHGDTATQPHVDTNPHADSNPHSDTNPHSDSGVPHSDTQHSDTRPHSDTFGQHIDNSPHDDLAGHGDTTTPHADIRTHDDLPVRGVHIDIPTHSDVPAAPHADGGAIHRDANSIETGAHSDDAGFHTTVLPISAGAVGRLPAMLVKLNGVTAKTKPSSGRCST